MLGIIGSLTKAVVGVVTLPVAVVADVITLGGVLTDSENPTQQAQQKTS